MAEVLQERRALRGDFGATVNAIIGAIDAALLTGDARQAAVRRGRT